MKTKTLATILTLGMLTAASGYAADSADANWKKHCLSCHGADGKGKTRAGRKAKVKDLTDSKVQSLYNDAQLLDQLKNGLKDKGGKEQMKPFSDKLSEAEMNDLIALVRKFGK